MALVLSEPRTMTISVLLIQEDDGQWSAQCLEYDLATQAKNLTDLYYELERALVTHIAVHEAEGITPFECLGPAPQEYWEMFDSAKLAVVGAPNPFRAPKTLRHPVPVPQFRVANRHCA